MSAERALGRDVERVTHSEAETLALARSVGATLEPGDVVALIGEMGTGKTVFARGIALGLGVTERVVSPTFTIVREYEGRVPFRHLDVYRLDQPRELVDLGLDELLEPDAVVVVEWGDAVRALLPVDALEVHLSVPPPEEADDDTRRIVLRMSGATWAARAAEVDAIAAGARSSDGASGAAGPG